MSKVIAFFVRNVDAGKYPFSVRDLYFYSYQEYLLAIKAAGAQAYFVTDNASYMGSGNFSRAWTIDAVCEVAEFQEVGPITADVVFDKGGFAGAGVKIVTDPRLEPVLGDKVVTYEKFGKYQPRSVSCADAAAVAAAIADMPGDMVVVKNPVSASGRQVYIGKKTELQVPPGETYPLLVQEFLDMSEGAPGLAEGVHDVRVMLAGHRIVGGTLRRPAPGGLHANVSRGGSERLLKADEIPEEVRLTALEIDGLLDDLPRYYAVDFARGKQGWRMMELNARPGLVQLDLGPLVADFQKQFAQYIVSLA